MLKCISLALMYSMMLQNQLSVENYKPTSDPKSKLLKIKMDNFVVRTGNILLRQVVNSLLFYCFIMHLPYVTNILLKSRLFISLSSEFAGNSSFVNRKTQFECLEASFAHIKSSRLFCVHPKYFIRGIGFN